MAVEWDTIGKVASGVRLMAAAPQGRAAGAPVEPLGLVLDALRTHGALTRAALVQVTGLSRTTVSGLLGALRHEGLVDGVPDRTAVATGGRPAALLALTTRAGLAVGVDLGRRHVRVVVADLGQRLLGERVERVEVDDHADRALDLAATLALGTVEEVGGSSADVLGVGLGVPAPLDVDGSVGASNILPGWVGRTPGTELSERLGLPVAAENDANLGALAEATWGAGRGRSLVFYLKAATGIGGGIVQAGTLLRGASGTAGEIGHLTVDDSGAVCRCGNRGCLELTAGGAALVGQLATSGLAVRDIADVVRAAASGDAGARRVLADAGDAIGLAIAGLVNLLNPQIVVMGGELSLAGDLVLDSLRARVQRCAVAPAAAAVSVVVGVLGDRAEALGAALLVLRASSHADDPLLRRVLASEAIAARAAG